jgi:hypothetical protein
MAASSCVNDPEAALAPYVCDSCGHPPPYQWLQQLVQRNKPALAQRRELALSLVNVLAPGPEKFELSQEEVEAKAVISPHLQLRPPIALAERVGRLSTACSWLTWMPVAAAFCSAIPGYSQHERGIGQAAGSPGKAEEPAQGHLSRARGDAKNCEFVFQTRQAACSACCVLRIQRDGAGAAHHGAHHVEAAAVSLAVFSEQTQMKKDRLR